MKYNAIPVPLKSKLKLTSFVVDSVTVPFSCLASFQVLQLPVYIIELSRSSYLVVITSLITVIVFSAFISGLILSTAQTTTLPT